MMSMKKMSFSGLTIQIQFLSKSPRGGTELLIILR